MSLLSLIPTPVLAGAAVVAAGAMFAGGARVEGWRDAAALGAEKLAHQADVAKLDHDWNLNLEAMRKLADAAQADLDAERKANEIARENADVAHAKTIAALKLAADRNNADTQRVRDQLATDAAAAMRASGNSGEPGQASAGASCGGPGGAATYRFLSRALDLAARCSDAIGQQHAAVILAVDSWPK